MAAVLPEATRSAFAASYIMDLESMFDLDTVLTGADDYYNDQMIITEPPSVVVSDLPTVVTDDVCAVCMEEFRADEGGKQIPCGHVYHQSCISSWLSVGDCCPLCRCHVSSDNKLETTKPVQV
ncbi:E3 ubiquitin-protein ligase RNF181-like [Cucurbita maxima]|uniref:E3 ubiquitin-protein ligase RNF181-like n=1 Tax=Cucurbita maxima TaxID=3661 RepID=A0A6J1HNM2_CUCMA|nr:E3 ubiquitin-protein ligase RNF181-like [Cucurbita maxima]